MINRDDVLNKALSSVLAAMFIGGVPWLWTVQAQVDSTSKAIESMAPVVSNNRESVIRAEEQLHAINDKLDDISETQRITLKAIQHLED